MIRLFVPSLAALLPLLLAVPADAAAGRTEFPKPKGGGNVQVNYPFIFRLGGGG